MDANILAEAGYENAVSVNFCPVTLSLPRYRYLFSLLSAIIHSRYIQSSSLMDVFGMLVHRRYT